LGKTWENAVSWNRFDAAHTHLMGFNPQSLLPGRHGVLERFTGFIALYSHSYDDDEYLPFKDSTIHPVHKSVETLILSNLSDYPHKTRGKNTFRNGRG
jgi:hypothetical protein